MNGDGIRDVVGVSTEPRDFHVFLGVGDGRLAPAVVTAPPEAMVAPLATADPNGDGMPELIVGSEKGALLLQGTRDGRLTSPRTLIDDSHVYAAAFFDVNRDGVPDLVQLTTSKSVLEITLSGGVDAGQPTVSYPAPSVTSLLVLDIDGDGHLDVALPSASMAVITILLGRGDGTFEQRLSIPVAMASDSVIGFSQPHPGRGRDLLHKRVGGTTTAVKTDPIISIATSTGRACPSSDAGL